MDLGKGLDSNLDFFKQAVSSIGLDVKKIYNKTTVLSFRIKSNIKNIKNIIFIVIVKFQN